ncbi:MAG: peptidyl-prolyl cis-trans isomerase [Eubacteriales bacterium]|nr:peptidyl-prolyl cis-trans isomerase [Eubacteriales bacterium]
MNSSKKLLNKNNEERKPQGISAPSSKTTLGGGAQGPNTKAIVLGVFCVLLVLVLCIGVGVQQFKPQIVLKVNDTKFSMDNMMYPIYERESEYLPSNELYEQYMGTSVWDASYMGEDPTVDTSLSNAEGLKQEIINAETEYEVLYQEAVKADYKLTDDEKKDAEEQAQKALKGLSWSQKMQLAISKNKLVKRFEKRILADRYKKDKQAETDATVDEKQAIAEVSKTDLREYDIEYYSFSKTYYDEQTGQSVDREDTEIADLEKELKKLAKKAKKADDFTTLLGEDSESSITFEEDAFTEEDGWSDYLSDANVKKIKAMKNGEISDVIADEDTGYYMIVKMVNNNSTESYDEACDEAVENAKTDAYYSWLDEIKKDYTIKTYDSVWDDVTIGTVTTSIVTADDLSKMAESDSSEATSEDQ